jgi:hypothetical protein
MFSHFVDLISRLLMALSLITKHKLLLLNKDRLQGVLRVDAVDGGFDEAKDICDHFASNPSNLGRTSTGISKIFLKYFSRGLLSHSQTAKSAWMHHHFKTINKRSLIDFSGLSLMMVLNFYVWQGLFPKPFKLACEF